MDIKVWQYHLLAWIYLSIKSSMQQATIYISPSPSTPCPHPSLPCLTLSQFAANSTMISDSSITLIFLSGNHSLNLTMSVSNITNLTMLSVSSTLPQIMCHQGEYFSFFNISQVLIRTLRFIGCGDGKATISNITIDKSIFQGRNGTRTALTMKNTIATIINSSFISYTVGSYRDSIEILKNQTLFANVGGAIVATGSNITMKNSAFIENSADIGGAIFCETGTNITVIECMIAGNQGCHKDNDSLCFGGALHCENGFTEISVAHIIILNSEFSKNNATHGGFLTTYGNFNVTVKSNRFYGNKMMKNPWYSWGGVFDFHAQTTAHIEFSDFYDNGLLYTKGGVFYIKNSSVVIYGCQFWNNSVRSFGGVISMFEGSVVIDSCRFYNRGYQGGVLDASQYSSITINNSTFTGNSVDKVDKNNSNAAYGGVMIMSFVVKLAANKTVFSNNTALKHGGVIFATIANITFESCQFIENQSGEDGGVMYLTWSEVTLFEANQMMDNLATGNGGAMFASSNSIMTVYNRLDIINNVANESGGGFYLYRSVVINSTMTLKDNRAADNGGGVYATISVLRVLSDRDSPADHETSVEFTSNMSQMGGGIYLALTYQVYVIKSGNNYTRTIYSLHFTANSANYGGAIYVADETNSEQCASISYMNLSVDTECFLQVISPISIDVMKYNYISIKFAQNTAKISGSTLYGGVLDRCTLDPKAEISLDNVQITNHTGGPVEGFIFFKNVSDIDDVIDNHTISSKPVSICFCYSNDSDPHACSTESHSVRVMKGQMFNVSVIAIDQINQSLSNISIYASLRDPESGMGEGQMVQSTAESCTNLTFSIYSKNSTEDLILYAKGPCKNATRSRKTIKIHFLNCRCPIGFSPNQSMVSSCSCKCDPRLQQYITNCNSSTHTLERDGNFWITYILRNVSNTSEGGDYLVYPNCPFDYCVQPHSKKVQINLNNTIDGSDTQCANNRSGLLCGACQPNFSLSLSSSRCIPCSEQSWQRSLPVLVVARVLAGIGLVVLIFILNLTVAQGTLNGLIFYANIIGANESTFFPSVTYINRPAYTFLSWLNLELGFDVCFFKGMDTYWKTWLQLVFPTYVISLVVLIIFVSGHSLRFTRLISNARKNPVAALATLIMLSYAKFLRTIITTLSFAILHYHNGTKRVWLADATVEYFSVKHSVLFSVAFLILIVGIVYTLLLLCWQWILRFISHRYPRLCHFFEVYHVPYITKYHYWTGLVLVVRVLLYLVFALNTSWGSWCGSHSNHCND